MFTRNELFDEFFRDPFFSHTFEQNTPGLMKTDIMEKDGFYLLDIELPGYDREEVHAQLHDGYLTISAEHSPNKQVEGDIHYIRKERYFGACKRSFYVGPQVHQEDITAAFKNGILKLSVPKDAPKPLKDVPHYIPIN